MSAQLPALSLSLLYRVWGWGDISRGLPSSNSAKTRQTPTMPQMQAKAASALEGCIEISTRRDLKQMVNLRWGHINDYKGIAT